MKRDRAEELRELMLRIGVADMRVQDVMKKAWAFSPDELDALLVMPDETYPITQRDVTFKNKAQVRICRYAHMSKRDWPAGLQASHERTALFTKISLVQAEKKVKRITTVVNQVIVVPAPQMGAIPDDQVKRVQRDERGQLRPIDVEVVK